MTRLQAADLDPFRPNADQGRFKDPGVIGAERRAFHVVIESASAFVLWAAPHPMQRHRLYQQETMPPLRAGGSKANAVARESVKADRQMLAVPFDLNESND
jgi:hypothetical protein